MLFKLLLLVLLRLQTTLTFAADNVAVEDIKKEGEPTAAETTNQSQSQSSSSSSLSSSTTSSASGSEDGSPDTTTMSSSKKLKQLIESLVDQKVSALEERHATEMNRLYTEWSKERDEWREILHDAVQYEMSHVSDVLHKEINVDMGQVDVWMRHLIQTSVKELKQQQEVTLLSLEGRLREQHGQDLRSLERTMLAQVDSHEATLNVLTGKVEQSMAECSRQKSLEIEISGDESARSASSGSANAAEDASDSSSSFSNSIKSRFLRSPVFQSAQQRAALTAIELQRVIDSVNDLSYQFQHFQQSFSCIDQTMSDERDLYFSGCNVHIRNGLDSTYTTNEGRGNLILGYNEETTSCAGNCERSGSHNLIIGAGHNYKSYGGIVMGERSEIAGEHAVAIGIMTVASGFHSMALGGLQNQVSGSYSTVVGGRLQEASGDYSAILGGLNNRATGSYASVWAGHMNLASGKHAIIAGGEQNTAENDYTLVEGGYLHHTSVPFETVLDELLPLDENETAQAPAAGGVTNPKDSTKN